MGKNPQPTSEVKAKRTAKDSVFIDLFRDKKNLLKLYKALHPEDASATVLYEGRGKDIINEYIHFCGVFNEQTRRLGMTREAVEETIRICKSKDYLKEYLSSREKEVSTIMMSLFDQQRVMEEYAEERAEEAAEKAARKAARETAKEATEKATKKADRATAERLIRKGQMSLEDIADCVPSLTLDELRQIEASTMQLT